MVATKRRWAAVLLAVLGMVAVHWSMADSPNSFWGGDSLGTASTAVAQTTVAGAQNNQGPTFHMSSVGLDIPLEPMGLASDDTINPDQGTLIWFTGAGRVEPGKLGTAVIAGHVNYQGTPDVFANLDRARVGDVVQTSGQAGEETSWVVREVDVIGKETLQHDTRVWGSQTQDSRLVLITCDDELGFRPDGHRVANRVIFAEKMP